MRGCCFGRVCGSGAAYRTARGQRVTVFYAAAMLLIVAAHLGPPALLLWAAVFAAIAFKKAAGR